MKTARRLLSMVLALLMVFALVACAGDGETTNTNTNTQGSNVDQPSTNTGDSYQDVTADTSFQPPERPVSEMSGKTYVIIQHSPIEEPFGYGQDSKMGELVAAREAEVEALYECNIEFEQIAYNDNFPSSLQQLYYGMTGGDMVFSYNNAKLRLTLGTGGDTSLMLNLLVVDNIINFWDFNKWGNITSRETMMAGGTFYGVSPALWVDCTPLPYYQVVYSKDKITEFGQEDPQEIWERGEWDRDVMLDIIVECYDDASGDTIWGMTATLNHMVRATFLATGKTLINIDKINSDGSVEWSRGLEDPNAVEALQWLKNSLTAYNKHFNNGAGDWTTWDSHTPFINGLCAFTMSRPANLFSNIVIDSSNFGLITWAGADANVLSGYYENCYSVAIPLFCQNYEHSAFLMYDLFEGLDGIEDYGDVIEYYRTEYFDSDVDVEVLLRENATLMYSYWPNGLDSIWSSLSGGLMTTSSVSALISKYAESLDSKIEEHILPNTVMLEAYRQNGYFN